MKTLAILASATALTLAVVSFTGPAQAAVIADFSPATNAADYSWMQSALGTGGEFSSRGSNGPTSGCTTCAATHFSFLEPSLSALAFVPATFQLDALVADGHPATQAPPSGGNVWTQTNIDGGFHFTYFDHTHAVGSTQTFGSVTLVNGVTNLLSGVFTGAWIQGAGGSGSANLAVGNGGHLTLASDVMSFSHVVSGTEEFAFNLLNVSPNFAADPGKSLNDFTANGGGNFSAQTLGVPEASTWALMIMGFGGVGAMIRNRRRLAPASI